MARALVLAVGTRGHHEPAIALTQALADTARFDAVHLVLQHHYLSLLPPHHAVFTHALPMAKDATSRLFLPLHVRHVAAAVVHPVDQMHTHVSWHRAVLANLVVPSLSFVHSIAVAHRPSVIVCTPLFAPVAATLAEYLGVPLVMLQFVPSSPTTQFPHILSDSPSSQIAAQLIAHHHRGPDNPHSPCLRSYQTFAKLVLQPSLPRLNALRSRLHLPHVRLPHDPAAPCFPYACRTSVSVINAYIPQLVPRVPSSLPSTHHVPPLALHYQPADWSPETHCPNLIAYLMHARGKPLCVTLGPTPLLERRGVVTRALLSGLRAAGVQEVLIVKGDATVSPASVWPWGDGLKRWCEESVHVCDEPVQFSWLFPFCDAVLCHGGIGTVSSALCARLPVVVAPAFGDQMFWATLVSLLGVGATVKPDLRSGTTKSFEKAITMALCDGVRANCKRFGEFVGEQGNGAELAADIIVRLAA